MAHAKNLTMEAFPLVTILARRNKAAVVVVDPSDDVPAFAAKEMTFPSKLGERPLPSTAFSGLLAVVLDPADDKHHAESTQTRSACFC